MRWAGETGSHFLGVLSPGWLEGGSRYAHPDTERSIRRRRRVSLIPSLVSGSYTCPQWFVNCGAAEWPHAIGRPRARDRASVGSKCGHRCFNANWRAPSDVTLRLQLATTPEVRHRNRCLTHLWLREIGGIARPGHRDGKAACFSWRIGYFRLLAARRLFRRPRLRTIR